MFQNSSLYLSEGITLEPCAHPNIVKLVVKLFRTRRLLRAGAGERLTRKYLLLLLRLRHRGHGLNLIVFSFKLKCFVVFCLSLDRDGREEDGNWTELRDRMRGGGTSVADTHTATKWQVTPSPPPDRPVTGCKHRPRIAIGTIIYTLLTWAEMEVTVLGCYKQWQTVHYTP